MAACGTLKDWAEVQLHPDLREKFGAMQFQNYTFLWYDKNGDGIPQAEDVQILDGDIGRAFVGEDLSFNFSDRRLRPTGFLPNGVPQYDLAAMEKMPWVIHPAPRARNG